MTSDSTSTGGRGAWRKRMLASALAAIVLPGFSAAAQLAAADTVGYHLYVHGFLSNGIVGYNASDTAAPTPIAGRPTPGALNWPQAATPDGRFLFAAPGSDPRLIPYAIGADGELTPGTALPMPDVPVDIVFAPNNRDAFVLVGLQNAKVVPVRIGADGTPVPNGAPIPFGEPLDGVASGTVSPDGRQLYVASLLPRQLLVFDIGADGSVSPAKQRIGTGLNPIYPRVSPDGRHVYVVNEISGSMSGYARAQDGSLTEIAGSPFPTGLLPHVTSMTPDGRFLYVPNMGSAHISAFAVEPSGALTPLPDVDFAPGQPGVFAESTVLSPSGDVLWALGTDPLRGGEEILRRFRIGPDGILDLDESVSVYTGTYVADGRTMSLVSRR
ncbi:lactonase family protein [Nocardia amikacinitolerans]|uniref:lactonase family protein n=1 Tax=Nocardia amikacinitolerans TaxID=756689 RepID=UPI0020A5A33D|nr:beta-propeller fold lactonase family protein [Nocardia amikacinitolerans]